MAHSPLLLQIVIILGCARILGSVLRFLGQPMVVGEMVAGLVLGPPVLGALAPNVHAALFPPSSLPELDAISQMGLVLFMFVVGAELRLPAGAKAQIAPAIWIGALSIVLPMGFGFAAAYPFYPILAPPGVSFGPFAFFLAAAMSITAFPVMARILKDRAETQTRIGRLSLTGAAVADVGSWIVLAIVLVIAQSSSDWTRVAQMLGGLAALGVLLFCVLRPLIIKLLAKYANDGCPTGTLLASLLIGTFASAYASAYIGVHAVFGAFLFGACLPRDDRLLHSLTERIEHVAVLALLPVFFALAGLNTSQDAFSGGQLGMMLLLILIAVVGKFVGGSFGARIAGEPWRPAIAIGALMNARGLMELIVMKVGLDAGLIGKSLFTMLLLMAIVTTVMAGPMLNLLTLWKSERPEVASVSRGKSSTG